MTQLLNVQGIAAGYLNRPVLHALSLSLHEGEALAVIGPNGHGKTTLLRALSGLVPLRSGSIKFAGRRLDQTSVHGRVEAGLIHVPQGDQLFVDMTVEENLLMGAYLVGDQGEVRRRIDKVFSLFPRLLERRMQSVRALSGGERRMVGIGRGLMATARLLMIDEPSLGLAPLLIEQIYEALGALRAEGYSFLVVEENPSRIVKFADRICLLDAGQFVWSGIPDEAVRSEGLLKTYFGGGL